MPQLATLRLSRGGTTRTDLTCNCLLPSTRRATEGEDSAHTRHASPQTFYAAFYQLGTAGSDERPVHFGDIAQLEMTEAAATVTARASSATSLSSASAPSASTDESAAAHRFPGVFDVVPLPRGVRFPASGAQPPCGTAALIAACTDGSARLLSAQTLATLQVFPSVHAEMLTSATPLFGQASAGDVCLRQLLCTAHTGAVLLFDVARSQVTQTLEGHDFDAWCGAVRVDNESTLGDGNGCGEARLLFSGGDDGLLKFYDARASNAAVAKVRFDAGVVSVSPVVSGPYLLVGSYAETLSLVDERYRKRPVAECGGLGGGVWRTNRLLPSWTRVDADEQADDVALPVGCVPAAGTLFVPLMQRGAAVIAYDVRAPSADVFTTPLYVHAPAECGDNRDGDSASAWAAGSTCGNVCDDLLVYDVAVLSSAAADQRVDVLTCSFYEKRIEQWRIERVPEVS